MKLRLFLYLAVIFTFFNTGCQDNSDTTTDPTATPNIEILNGLLTRSDPEDGQISLGCYSITMPFQMVDDQGVVYTISNDSMFSAFIDTIDNGPTIVDFVYPLHLTHENGETAVANNIEELGALFAACVPEGGFLGGNGLPAYLISFENSCFELQFPVSLVAGDVVTSVSNAEEFNELVASNFYTFGYPVNLRDHAGVIATAPSDVELMNLLIGCCGIPNIGDSTLVYGSFFLCYDAQFPLTLLSSATSTVVVNNNDELFNQLMQGNVSGFVYPITLIKENGSNFLVQNDDELSVALDACSGGPVVGGNSAYLLFVGTKIDSTGNGPCYTINFPITTSLTSATGTTSQMTFENLESFSSAILSGQQWINADVILPVSVVLTENQQTVVVNSFEQLLEIINSCH